LQQFSKLIVERGSGILYSMIVCPNAPPLTVEDYRSLPEAGPRYQLIEGDLYIAPAPNRFHQEISRNLQVKLFVYLRESGLGKIFGAHSTFTLTRRMFISRIWS
jgi:Uma2 family endonuclease